MEHHLPTTRLKEGQGGKTSIYMQLFELLDIMGTRKDHREAFTFVSSMQVSLCTAVKFSFVQWSHSIPLIKWLNEMKHKVWKEISKLLLKHPGSIFLDVSTNLQGQPTSSRASHTPYGHPVSKKKKTLLYIIWSILSAVLAGWKDSNTYSAMNSSSFCPFTPPCCWSIHSSVWPGDQNAACASSVGSSVTPISKPGGFWWQLVVA